MRSCLNLPSEKKHAWQMICIAEKIALSRFIISCLEIIIKSENLLKRAIKHAKEKNSDKDI
jgi:hypothetical protein